MKKDISNILFMTLSILLLVFFVPVLFSVVVIGNNMDYWDAMKITVNLPNGILFILALLTGGICCLLFVWEKKHFADLFALKRGWIVNIALAVLFIGLYFLNVWIAREIAFHLPWDIMEVAGAAYTIAKKESMGYQYYFSIYPNNIPIAYILGRIYRKVGELKEYPYLYDFAWV